MAHGEELPPVPADLDIASEDVLDQAVRWRPTQWLGRDSLVPYQTLLEQIAASSEPFDDGERLIRRRHVVEHASDPMLLFVAGMVWGFGTRGYGAYRTGKVLSEAGADLQRRLGRIQDGALASPAGAWDAFTDPDIGKMRGLGPSFATKFAYFTNLRQERAWPTVLIADLNTAWAMWDLVALPRSASRRDSYLAYVDIASEWARQLGCRPDDIERALFEHGRSVPR